LGYVNALDMPAQMAFIGDLKVVELVCKGAVLANMFNQNDNTLTPSPSTKIRFGYNKRKVGSTSNGRGPGVRICQKGMGYGFQVRGRSQVAA
jgi:hypothetical protein